METAHGRLLTCPQCGQKDGVHAPGCPDGGYQPIGLQGFGGSIATNPLVQCGPLKRMLGQLAKLAWKSLGSLEQRAFLLDPLQLPHVHASHDLERVLETILSHARRVAPGLSVPHFVPHVQLVPLSGVGGIFGEEADGWVRIAVANQFLTHPLTVQAILAHEACHYMLESAEVREVDRHQNERLTDCCMFICGLGKVFLAGYRTEPGQLEYRRGHRLGYLTDEEYQFADRYVLEIRHANTLGLAGEVEALQQRLAHVLSDVRVRDRLLIQARRKHPTKDDVWIYHLVIEQLLRDRR